MSIQDKITRLQTAKTDIAEAITSKGGNVNEGDGFEEFSADIAEIPEGCYLDSTYTISDGILSSGNTWIEGDLKLVIPEGVTSINQYAFAGTCSYMLSVDLPSSLTYIGDYAFDGCKLLTSLKLPVNLRTIGQHAFSRCADLITIDASESSISSINNYAFEGGIHLGTIDFYNTPLRSLGKYAFKSCQSLYSAVLPDTILFIQDGAFAATQLQHIYYAGTREQWGQVVKGTNAIPQSCTIHYEYTPE